MFLYKLIATFFGIGYIGKGAGTIASMFVGVLLYVSAAFHLHLTILLSLLSILFFIAGVIAANKVEKSWGKDNKRMVIDKVMGMTVSLIFLPINLGTLVMGLVLFSFNYLFQKQYVFSSK